MLSVTRNKIRRCILHIGTEKTGTSTLQKFLVDNRPRLKRIGVRLSTAAGWANNRKLAAYFQPRVDDGYFRDKKLLTPEQRSAHFKDFESTFLAEMGGLPSTAHTVILTTEFFHSRLTTPESVGALKDFLSTCFEEFIVICYFREQSRLARSLYSTSIKGGSTRELEDYAKGIAPGNSYYDCCVIADLWSGVFSDHQFIARIFDPTDLIGHDILTDFLATALPDVTTDVFRFPEERRNEGLGGIGLAIGRAINSVYPRYDANGNLSQRRRNLIGIVENSEFCRQGDVPFPSAMRIYNAFDASNREFAKRYLHYNDNPFRQPSLGCSDSRLSVEPSELIEFIAKLIAIPSV